MVIQFNYNKSFKFIHSLFNNKNSKAISGERIGLELRKILSQKFSDSIIKMFYDFRINEFIGELYFGKKYFFKDFLFIILLLKVYQSAAILVNIMKLTETT